MRGAAGFAGSGRDLIKDQMPRFVDGDPAFGQILGETMPEIQVARQIVGVRDTVALCLAARVAIAPVPGAAAVGSDCAGAVTDCCRASLMSGTFPAALVVRSGMDVFFYMRVSMISAGWRA